jgi:hypothetical protein
MTARRTDLLELEPVQLVGVVVGILMQVGVAEHPDRLSPVRSSQSVLHVYTHACTCIVSMPAWWFVHQRRKHACSPPPPCTDVAPSQCNVGAPVCAPIHAAHTADTHTHTHTH